MDHFGFVRSEIDRKERQVEGLRKSLINKSLF